MQVYESSDGLVPFMLIGHAIHLSQVSRYPHDQHSLPSEAVAGSMAGMCYRVSTTAHSGNQKDIFESLAIDTRSSFLL